ncbi:unnamed protein product [Schistosoma mattheei]|uniref:Uncharacterized protein n=1 Tax=Schistosoma mattheei TaxID=31246 RepID=A0AA85BE64_9TREM|nr:unnamed protein product [Schistosoma mattheei]
MTSPCIKNSQNRESDFDRRLRAKEENKRHILFKNENFIEEREKLGFPPKYPTLTTLEDSTNISNLASASSINRLEEKRGIDRRKPQNMSPGVVCNAYAKMFYYKDINAFREGSNMAPPETLNKPLPMHDKFISDQDMLNTRRLTGDDKIAQNYLYTSSYEAAYGNRSKFYGNTCRRLYPIKSSEAVADPIRGLLDSDSYYPSTKSWMPELFNPVQYDQKQARYLHIKEDRPYEFNLNLPGYSGYQKKEMRSHDLASLVSVC